MFTACALFPESSSADACAGGLRENQLWRSEQATYKPFMTNMRSLKRNVGYILSSSESAGMKQCSVDLCQVFVSAVNMKEKSGLKRGKRAKLMKEIILKGIDGLQDEKRCRAAIQVINAKSGGFLTGSGNRNGNNNYYGHHGGFLTPTYPHNSNKVLIVNTGGDGGFLGMRKMELKI